MSADGLLSSSAQQSFPWDWTTQIRSEFWAIAFSLAAVLIVIRSPGRQSLIAAAILAGMAPAVKQTFIAAPGAVFIWLLVEELQERGDLVCGRMCDAPCRLRHCMGAGAEHVGASVCSNRFGNRLSRGFPVPDVGPLAAHDPVRRAWSRACPLDTPQGRSSSRRSDDCPGSSQRPQFSTRAATSTTSGSRCWRRRYWPRLLFARSMGGADCRGRRARCLRSFSCGRARRSWRMTCGICATLSKRRQLRRTPAALELVHLANRRSPDSVD